MTIKSPRVSIPKSQKLGGLKKQDLSSHRSGGSESKMKVPVELFSLKNLGKNQCHVYKLLGSAGGRGILGFRPGKTRLIALPLAQKTNNT